MAFFTGTTDNDTLTGTSENDDFNLGQGGSDVARGLAGTDSFELGGTFDVTDTIDGGGNADRMVLQGDYDGLAISAAMMRNIESIQLESSGYYRLTVADDVVAAGRNLAVSVGGPSAYLNFDGSAETDGSFSFFVSTLQDSHVLIGGANDDSFVKYHGDPDWGSEFRGNAGDDRFTVQLVENDQIFGGSGYDTVELLGHYSSGLQFTTNTLNDIERFVVAAGGDSRFTTRDSNVGAGQQLEVDAAALGTADRIEFDGAAETNGSFLFKGGRGDDVFTGGTQADRFVLNRAGDDVLNGGGGDDAFDVSAGFTAADQLNGGSGNDTVHLAQDLSGGLKFAAQTLVGIETIELAAGHDYRLTLNEGTVAVGAILTVDGSELGAADVLRVNGAAETNGRLFLTGGAGTDALRGGAMADRLGGGEGSDKLVGGAGGDILTGGLGHDNPYGGEGGDRFIFTDIAESTVAGADWIRDWGAGDRIDLSAIDANTGVADDQAFTFIGAGPFTAAGQLQAINTASLNTIIRGDIDGDGGADFTIKLTGIQSLSDGSFIL
jgi:hypothetical protein